MDSKKDSNIPVVPPPRLPQMDIKDLSLTSSPFLRTSAKPKARDPKLLQKLGLTADDLGEAIQTSESEPPEPSEPEPEPESPPDEVCIERIPTVSFGSEASKDIISDFNTENKLHQDQKQKRKSCLCYQKLAEEDEDDDEDLEVSIRSPSGNKKKIAQQLREFQSDMRRFKQFTPAGAGIPITTPRKSVYPKRPMSISLIDESDTRCLQESCSPPKCSYCPKQKTAPGPRQNISSRNADTFYLTCTPQFGSGRTEQGTINLKKNNTKKIKQSKQNHPVTDLRRTYAFPKASTKKLAVKNSTLKKSEMVNFKDEVMDRRTPELITILPHEPVGTHTLERKNAEQLEYNISLMTPETIIRSEAYDQETDHTGSHSYINEVPSISSNSIDNFLLNAHQLNYNNQENKEMLDGTTLKKRKLGDEAIELGGNNAVSLSCYSSILHSVKEETCSEWSQRSSVTEYFPSSSNSLEDISVDRYPVCVGSKAKVKYQHWNQNNNSVQKWLQESAQSIDLVEEKKQSCLTGSKVSTNEFSLESNSSINVFGKRCSAENESIPKKLGLPIREKKERLLFPSNQQRTASNNHKRYQPQSIFNPLSPWKCSLRYDIFNTACPKPPRIKRTSNQFTSATTPNLTVNKLEKFSKLPKIREYRLNSSTKTQKPISESSVFGGKALPIFSKYCSIERKGSQKAASSKSSKFEQSLWPWLYLKDFRDRKQRERIKDNNLDKSKKGSFNKSRKTK